ncbi:SdiA-regulated domain-containing protein [Uliginosibacterium sp. H3]|uniref:SdiA-regulated domain-containing protein n=1 Tax=Uliginosibacterium silvisoli TaxID=3114758 RepID=A0ABU6K2L9_9RHOO|nr:SdiA-regulated domain-containing protein [Uliginosibacterium sp. H3]
MKSTIARSLISAAVAALAAMASVPASAGSSINLANYSVTGIYSLGLTAGTGGSVSGLEASAVTYARDRGTLFFVGDEGFGVIETTLTGQTIGAMSFDWSGTGSSKHDTEGLTYVGNGQLVVTEERLYDAYKFSYVAGGTASLVNNGVSISNANVGNSGVEGISYDPRNGTFVTVKQEAPEDILAGSLSFGANLGGTSTLTNLFNPALLGVASFSDVQTLSPVDALVGTTAADNLLILSLVSRKLLEVDRSGQVLSSLDLSNILPNNGIEGVTVDEKGTIYLVAEQLQIDGAPANSASQLIVLSAAAVPEPGTYAMLFAGLGLLGFVARRKKA